MWCNKLIILCYLTAVLSGCRMFTSIACQGLIMPLVFQAAGLQSGVIIRLITVNHPTCMIASEMGSPLETETAPQVT